MSAGIAPASISHRRDFPRSCWWSASLNSPGPHHPGTGPGRLRLHRPGGFSAPCPGDVLTVTARVVKAFGRLFMVEGGVDGPGVNDCCRHDSPSGIRSL